MRDRVPNDPILVPVGHRWVCIDRLSPLPILATGPSMTEAYRRWRTATLARDRITQLQWVREQ
jgi:hypothetical protein